MTPPIRRFAESTNVKAAATLAEIERLLTRYQYPPKGFVVERGDAQELWILRVECDSFTLRFQATYKHNPRQRLSDYHRRIKAGQRLMRVALLVIKGKFEEMAGQGEMGITVENIAVNLPSNFELEDGDTIADKLERTKWTKKLITQNRARPARDTSKPLPRLKAASTN